MTDAFVCRHIRYYWVGALVRAVFVLDDFFTTRIACCLCVIYHFIAFVFLY
jgi:hypothetical protein